MNQNKLIEIGEKKYNLFFIIIGSIFSLVSIYTMIAAGILRSMIRDTFGYLGIGNVDTTLDIAKSYTKGGMGSVTNFSGIMGFIIGLLLLVFLFVIIPYSVKNFIKKLSITNNINYVSVIIAFLFDYIIVNSINFINYGATLFVAILALIANIAMVVFAVMSNNKNKNIVMNDLFKKNNMNRTMNGQQVNQPMNGQQVNQPMNGQQVNQPMNGQQVNQPMNGQQVNQPMNGQQVNQPMNSEQMYQPVNNQQGNTPLDNQANEGAEASENVNENLKNTDHNPLLDNRENTYNHQIVNNDNNSNN